ncbi:hypothetical protein HDK90DRAFT_235346 [Phyllosticta capitalensis]|uniref:Uncharacterized protein n=1 Tax=Phyllosticta capitalensis TaxID=121624 RepID=A0ABR1YNV5_9PEZI
MVARHSNPGDRASSHDIRPRVGHPNRHKQSVLAVSHSQSKSSPSITSIHSPRAALRPLAPLAAAHSTGLIFSSLDLDCSNRRSTPQSPTSSAPLVSATQNDLKTSQHHCYTVSTMTTPHGYSHAHGHADAPRITVAPDSLISLFSSSSSSNSNSSSTAAVSESYDAPPSSPPLIATSTTEKWYDQYNQYSQNNQNNQNKTYEQEADQASLRPRRDSLVGNAVVEADLLTTYYRTLNRQIVGEGGGGSAEGEGEAAAPPYGEVVVETRVWQNAEYCTVYVSFFFIAAGYHHPGFHGGLFHRVRPANARTHAQPAFVDLHIGICCSAPGVIDVCGEYAQTYPSTGELMFRIEWRVVGAAYSATCTANASASKTSSSSSSDTVNKKNKNNVDNNDDAGAFILLPVDLEGEILRRVVIVEQFRDGKRVCSAVMNEEPVPVLKV